MRNKIFVLLMVLSLSVTLMACGEKESQEPQVSNETNAEAVVPKDQVEPVEKTQAEEKTDTEDANKEESSDEKNGVDLFQSMKTQRPEKLRIVSEMTAYNMTTTMTTYYDGDKSRTEIDIPDMPKSILISIPDEQIVYQYVYGESTGMKITGVDKEGAEEMGLMMDTSLLTALTDGASDDITAKAEKLDGEEVIYIEATQADEDMGEMLVKMWYSEKYAIPLKYEVYVGEALMTKLNVIKIHDKVNYNADTFMPPEDVDFQEINMDTMMNFE